MTTIPPAARDAPNRAACAESRFDVDAIAAQFPILTERMHGQRLCYLDNAATTQQPNRVIDAVSRFSRESNAAVHRGVHVLSARATEAYEQSRSAAARFLGAKGADEIIFLRGATEAINMLAFTLGERLSPGDEIIVTLMEHHSNLLPWQETCRRTCARLRVIPLDEHGDLRLDELDRLLNERTRIVAVTHISNVLGTINPVEEIVRRAKQFDAITVIDGAQAASHLPIDVRAIGCDFYAISGHKMYAPTGIGALFGRRELLHELPPWQTGGSMVERVKIDSATWAAPPARFEAGSPNASGAIGLASAIEFLDEIGFSAIEAHEQALASRAIAELSAMAGVRIHGLPRRRSPVISFTIDGAHPHDVASVLDAKGVAVRAGHHCAQPLTDWLGVAATTRASLGVFNREEDISAFLAAVACAREVLR